MKYICVCFLGATALAHGELKTAAAAIGWLIGMTIWDIGAAIYNRGRSDADRRRYGH